MTVSYSKDRKGREDALEVHWPPPERKVQLYSSGPIIERINKINKKVPTFVKRKTCHYD